MQRKHLKEMGEALADRDPEGVYEEAREIVRECVWTFHLGSGMIADLNKTGKEQWERYEIRKAAEDGILGIRSPWDLLDQETGGFKPGDLTTIVARLGVGKSWLALLLADAAERQGKNVGFVSLEMEVEAIEIRRQAIKYGIPYRDLKRGELDNETEERLKEELLKEKNGGPRWFIATGARVSTIAEAEMFVEETQCDFLIIDGIYLMNEGDGRMPMHERVMAAIRGLKRLGQRKRIPTSATAQFNRTVKKGSMQAGSEAIGHTDAIGQDCIPGDALVLTDLGWRPVGLIANSRNGYHAMRSSSGEGNLGYFTAVDDAGIKKQAKAKPVGQRRRVKIQHSSGTFICSPNHKIPVIRDDGVVDVLAADIKKGDHLIQALGVAGGGNGRIVPSFFSDDLSLHDAGWLIGVFVGDGSCGYTERSKRHSQVTFACGLDEAYTDRVVCLLTKMGISNTKTTQRCNGTDNRQWIVNAWSIEMDREIRSAGLVDEELRTKVLPEWVFRAPRSFRAGVLTGLIQSDGWVSEKGIVEFKTRTWELANQVQRLCAGLGRPVGLSPATDDSWKVYFWRDYWWFSEMDLELTGKDEVADDLSGKGKSRAVPRGLLFEIASLLPESMRGLGIDQATRDLVYKVRAGQTVSLASLVRIQHELGVDLGRFLRHYSRVDLVEVSSESEEMYDVTVLNGPDPYFLCEGLRVHNSDNVIGAFRDKETREANLMFISMLKVREGVPIEMTIAWDFETMGYACRL